MRDILELCLKNLPSLRDQAVESHFEIRLTIAFNENADEAMMHIMNILDSAPSEFKARIIGLVLPYAIQYKRVEALRIIADLDNNADGLFDIKDIVDILSIKSINTGMKTCLMTTFNGYRDALNPIINLIRKLDSTAQEKILSSRNMCGLNTLDLAVLDCPEVIEPLLEMVAKFSTEQAKIKLLTVSSLYHAEYPDINGNSLLHLIEKSYSSINRITEESDVLLSKKMSALTKILNTVSSAARIKILAQSLILSRTESHRRSHPEVEGRVFSMVSVLPLEERVSIYKEVRTFNPKLCSNRELYCGFSNPQQKIAGNPKLIQIEEEDFLKIFLKNHPPFDIDSFISDTKKYMQKEKMEYDSVKKTPVVGAVRAAATRYEEKRNFILNEIVPAIKACAQKTTEENILLLAKKFKKGAKEFTTFGKQSGLAIIFQQAYSDLTDKNKIKLSNFVSKVVTEIVVKEQPEEAISKQSPSPVLGIAAQSTAPTHAAVSPASFFSRSRSSVVSEVDSEARLYAELEQIRIPQNVLPIHVVAVQAEEYETIKAFEGSVRVFI